MVRYSINITTDTIFVVCQVTVQCILIKNHTIHSKLKLKGDK